MLALVSDNINFDLHLLTYKSQPVTPTHGTLAVKQIRNYETSITHRMIGFVFNVYKKIDNITNTKKMVRICSTWRTIFGFDHWKG